MAQRIIVDTNAMDWLSGAAVLERMAPEFRPHLGGTPQEQLDTYGKHWLKTLRLDPETTRRIDLIHLQPSFADLSYAYHDSVEECFCLDGEVYLEGEGPLLRGEYFWRPPGWVHAARTEEGFLALMSVEGRSEGDASAAHSRRIRPREEAGTNALVRSGRADGVGRRGWVRRLDPNLLPWLPGEVFARSEGPLAGYDLEHISFKILSKNWWTGAQSLLVQLHPGYAQDGPGTSTAAQEYFVIAGALQSGDRELAKGCYLSAPAGSIQPAVWTLDGATLFAKIDGWLDFHLSDR